MKWLSRLFHPIAVCFLLLAITLVSLAIRWGGLCWLLIYPAVSFFIVAVAYFGAGAKVFGKQPDGSRHWLASVLLAPYLAFANTTWHLIRLVSREEPMSQFGEDLILARRLLPHEVPEQVRYIIDLTCELSDPIEMREPRNYVCFPMLDSLGADAEELVAFSEYVLQMPCPVLIHCAQGHGRTGLVAAAALLVSGETRDARAALAVIQNIRPGIRLSRDQLATLQAVQKICTSVRYDGVYSHFDGAMHRHLRFFENGKVAFLLIQLEPERVFNGMTEEFQARCGGTFENVGGQISFIITELSEGRSSVVVEYRGTVSLHRLSLDIFSHTTGNRSQKVFDFHEHAP